MGVITPHLNSLAHWLWLTVLDNLDAGPLTDPWRRILIYDGNIWMYLNEFELIFD